MRGPECSGLRQGFSELGLVRYRSGQGLWGGGGAAAAAALVPDWRL